MADFNPVAGFIEESDESRFELIAINWIVQRVTDGAFVQEASVEFVR